MEYHIKMNGRISNSEGQSALQNVLFTCLNDDGIRRANEWKKRNNKKGE